MGNSVKQRERPYVKVYVFSSFANMIKNLLKLLQKLEQVH